MVKKGSWTLFLISIGLLFITISPKIDRPLIMILGGFFIVALGVIILKIKKKSQGDKRK